MLNGVTKLVVTWFPQKEEATSVGLGSLALLVGMMVGLGATPALVQYLGFETMLLIYGILGILGGLIFVQPDLSAVITIFFLGGLMFFLAGGDCIKKSP